LIVPPVETPELQMKRISLVVLSTALFTYLPASVLAQAPAAGNDAAAPAPAPAPAASPAPAPSAAPAPAPAASPAPAPAASPSADTGNKSADTGEKKAATKTKKRSTRMTRQQEIEHSISSGTVPSRYRSQVPKEYQKYIPFDKR
jgi:3-oxoacyl-ACP reductase-like protein